MELKRFFAPPSAIGGDIVRLAADETKHLRDVLRLREGDAAAVFDGDGREFRCTISSIGRSETVLRVECEIVPESPESPLRLTLATSILKGDKSDLVVQKAAELGVIEIQPVLAARCDVRPSDREKRVVRWRRIAMEAVKQCGRARLMSVRPLLTFADFASEQVKRKGSVIMFSERDGSPFSSIKKADEITAIFGPEGGWDDSEIELGVANGFKLITLGGRIMRAETAAISLAAVLQHRFGDLS